MPRLTLSGVRIGVAEFARIPPGVPGGILIYQDRGDAQNASINGALTLNGALYFPGAQLKLGGNLNSNYTIIVAQVIQFNGNFGIGSDYASLPEGSPVKAAGSLRLESLP